VFSVHLGAGVRIALQMSVPPTEEPCVGDHLKGQMYNLYSMSTQPLIPRI
jgi:hypothetical protein